jgi:hypothetical protein
MDEEPPASTKTSDSDITMSRQPNAVVLRVGKKGPLPRLPPAGTTADEALDGQPPSLGDWADVLWRPHAIFGALMLAAACALAWLALRCAEGHGGGGGPSVNDACVLGSSRPWAVAGAPLLAACLSGALHGARSYRMARARCAAGSARLREQRALASAALLLHGGGAASVVLAAAQLEGKLAGWCELAMGSGTAKRFADDGGWSAPAVLGALLGALLLLRRRQRRRAASALLLLLLAVQLALVACKCSASYAGQFSWRVAVLPAALASVCALGHGIAHAAPCCCCCAAPPAAEPAPAASENKKNKKNKKKKKKKKKKKRSCCARRFDAAARFATAADPEVGRPYAHPLPHLARKALALRAAATAVGGVLGLVAAWGACCRLDGRWEEGWSSSLALGAWARVPNLGTANALALGPPALAALLACWVLLLQRRWAAQAADALRDMHGDGSGRSDADILAMAAAAGGYLSTSTGVRAVDDTADPGAGLPSAVERRAWVPDETVTACQLCFSQFTFVHRRHHCRHCGKCVCDPCSRQRLILRGCAHPERVCRGCAIELRPFGLEDAAAAAASAAAVPSRPGGVVAFSHQAQDRGAAMSGYSGVV